MSEVSMIIPLIHSPHCSFTEGSYRVSISLEPILKVLVTTPTTFLISLGMIPSYQQFQGTSPTFLDFLNPGSTFVNITLIKLN